MLPSSNRRQPELDVMKAVSIVAVIGIHSIRDFWVPDLSAAELFIGQLTRFAVPTFLAVSGFLYYSPAPIGHTTIARRLRRILLPYACVSVVASVYSGWHPGHGLHDSFLTGLVLGGIFGPYYYVFLLAEFVAATWVLSRLPQRVTTALLALAVVSTTLVETQVWTPRYLFWAARSPHVWGAWFLLGWVAAAHRTTVFAVPQRFRFHILVAWMLLVSSWILLFWAGAAPGRLGRASTLVLIAANIIGLFTLGSGMRTVPRWMTDLSNWSYSIYLLHPFFVYAIHDVAGPALGLTPAALILLSWVAGLSGAVLLTGLMRRALGMRSRDLIGA